MLLSLFMFVLFLILLFVVYCCLLFFDVIVVVVREALNFYATLKLDSSVPVAQKNKLVEDIIRYTQAGCNLIRTV